MEAFFGLAIIFVVVWGIFRVIRAIISALFGDSEEEKKAKKEREQAELCRKQEEERKKQEAHRKAKVASECESALRKARERVEELNRQLAKDGSGVSEQLREEMVFKMALGDMQDDETRKEIARMGNQVSDVSAKAGQGAGLKTGLGAAAGAAVGVVAAKALVGDDIDIEVDID